LEAIRIVHAGGRLVPPAVAKVFSERAPQSELTARELEVLELIVDGKSNKRIAATLRISESTVKGHIVNIMSKLGADDRTQAATMALRRGIIHFERFGVRRLVAALALRPVWLSDSGDNSPHSKGDLS